MDMVIRSIRVSSEGDRYIRSWSRVSHLRDQHRRKTDPRTRDDFNRHYYARVSRCSSVYDRRSPACGRGELIPTVDEIYP